MLISALRGRIPAPCPLCGGRARGGALCEPCRQDIMPSAASVRCPRCALSLGAWRDCPDCRAREPAFSYAIAAFDYVAPADALVLQLKQSRRWGRAGMLGGLLADAVRADARGLPEAAVLVPIPSTPAALRRRGFNPAAEIARALGARLGAPVRSDILAPAAGQEGRQSVLSRAARLGRDHGRFRLRRPVSGMSLALVDDVMTTGSTLHAAAMLLRGAGAGPVTVLAVARTPHPPHLPS